MARPITSGMQTAISSESSTLCHFLEFQFSGGTTRLTTAPHDISWNGFTWTGIGGALSFEQVQESQDINASGVKMILSGVNQSILTILLQQFYIGRVVQIWLAHFDANGAIIADPLLLFNGKMNGGFEIEESHDEKMPGTVTILANMTDRLADLEQRNGIQTNLDSHQRLFSGDEFFEFVPDLASKVLEWPGPK